MLWVVTLAAFVFWNQSHAATAQVNNVVQSGAGMDAKVPAKIYPAGDSARHLSLIMKHTGGAANEYHGFYELGGAGTAQYQVPGGQTLECENMNVNSTAALGYTFGYATASFTEGTTTAPTGAQYYGPGDVPTFGAFFNTETTAAGVYRSLPVKTTFAATVFPFVQGNSGSTGYMILDCSLR